MDIWGGHPLVSLSLAKRYTNLGELFASVIKGTPSLGDEDLSREVQFFLYDELLSDPDSQNFAQRLSILVGRQHATVLEAVRRVAPSIRTSVGVLLDRFLGSVLEGDANNGFAVPPVFREIAKQRISADEQRAVYREVASALLQPEGNVIQAERAISGIMHSLLGEDTHTAMMWTVILVMNALREEPPRAQLEWILERLEIISFVVLPVDFYGQLMLTLSQMALATAFQRVNDVKRAAAILGRVRFDAVPERGDARLAKERNELRCACRMFRAVCLAIEDPVAALGTLEDLSAEELAELPDESWKTLLVLLEGLVSRCPYRENTGALTQRVIARASEDDAEERHSVLLLASSVAVRSKIDGLEPTRLEQVFGQSSLGRLLRTFCKATFLLESGREVESLTEIDSALCISHDMGFTDGQDVARLELTRGDAAFRIGNSTLAADAYANTVGAARKGSFEFAWGSWRLGVLREDEQLLLRSAPVFRSIGLYEMWSRVTGARGALLIKTERGSEGLECLADVINAYFVEKIETAGPAATVALAHVTRLRAQLAREPLIDESQFPHFETSPYETVISSALPRGGPTVAFFLIGETHRLFGGGCAYCLRKRVTLGAAGD